MAELAIKPMTLDEFLRWDDGSETHYELIGGFPVAMAPPAAAHRMLAARLVSRLDLALEKRRPCNAQGDAGVVRPERIDTYFEADIAATCERHEFGQQALKEPFLVEEILLIASDDIYAEVHRRAVGAQWITEILRGGEAVLSLASIPIEIRLSDLYEGIALEEGDS